MTGTKEQVAVFKDVPSRKSILFGAVSVISPTIVSGFWMFWVTNPTPLDQIVLAISSLLIGTSLMGLLQDLSIRQHAARARAKAAVEAEYAEDLDEDSYSD